MRRQVKVSGVLLIVLLSSYAVALQKPVLQQAGMTLSWKPARKT